MREHSMNARARASLVLALATATLAGCVGGAGGPRSPADVAAGRGGRGAVDPACIVGDRNSDLGDTVQVVVDGGLQPGTAPWPLTTAQRFVFAHLYETLVRVDCSGRVHPGLASSWRRQDPRTWIIDLRADARFSDGTPITAADVEASWKRLSAWALPMTLKSAMERTLIVEFPLETDDAIAVLAHPALAPSKPASRTNQYPAGGGSWDVALSPPGGVIMAPRGGNAPVIRVRQIGPAQARDQIDLGMTALLNAEPAVLDYARSRPDVTVQDLEWTHGYVLVVPGRIRPDPRDESEWLGALRAQLAEVAVPGARASSGTFWWEAAAHCGSVPGTASVLARGARTPTGAPREDNRIVYDALDRNAQRIAARLVALGGFQEGTQERAMLATAIPSFTGTRRLVAASLTATDMQRVMAAGEALAFVVPLPHRSLAPCLELAAPAPVGLTVSAAALAPNVIVPLVDVRPTLIMRRGTFSGTTGLLGAIRVGRVR